MVTALGILLLVVFVAGACAAGVFPLLLELEYWQAALLFVGLYLVSFTSGIICSMILFP